MSYFVVPDGDKFVVLDGQGKRKAGPYKVEKYALKRVRELNAVDAEMAPLKQGQKRLKCYSCPTMINSTGSHHRMCNICRQKSQPVAL